MDRKGDRALKNIRKRQKGLFPGFPLTFFAAGNAVAGSIILCDIQGFKPTNGCEEAVFTRKA